MAAIVKIGYNYNNDESPNNTSKSKSIEANNM